MTAQWQNKFLLLVVCKEKVLILLSTIPVSSAWDRFHDGLLQLCSALPLFP